MSESLQGGPRRDVEARLIDRAVREPAFRAELVRDPRAAIERELSAVSCRSVKLPAHVNVLVHEETADTFHLVLPPVFGAAGESSDAELAGAAGGKEQAHWTNGCSYTDMC